MCVYQQKPMKIDDFNKVDEKELKGYVDKENQM